MTDPFAFDAPPDRYLVVGNPIAHSQSPFIHACFAEQTGERMVYEAELVDEGGFAQAMGNFQASGGKGMNVTVPFKRDAWFAVDVRGPLAERAGSVNTISFLDDGRSRGDNTDGIGLVRDLCDRHDVVLSGRQVLVIGAGGAARGVIEPVLAEAPERLVVANRTPGRAERLRAEFADLGPIEACGLAGLAGRHFDCIVNATSASLQGEALALPDGIVEGAFCYDMMYGPGPTPFMRWALAHGARQAVDGLGMLVEQAAESFRIWRGVRPDTAPVIEALRARLESG